MKGEFHGEEQAATGAPPVESRRGAEKNAGVQKFEQALIGRASGPSRSWRVPSPSPLSGSDTGVHSVGQSTQA
jgi:hypothetical protein